MRNEVKLIRLKFKKKRTAKTMEDDKLGNEIIMTRERGRKNRNFEKTRCRKFYKYLLKNILDEIKDVKKEMRRSYYLLRYKEQKPQENTDKVPKCRG